MPYDKQIQEGLKRLIYIGKTERFKKVFNKIVKEDSDAAQEYLNGEHDEGRGLLEWVAMKRGGQELIDYLIDEVGVDINQQDGKGRTALLLAVDRGYMDNVRTLIFKGADVTIPDSQGNTPLHVAAEPHDNSTLLIEILCARGADVRATNKAGATPLHTAAKYSIEAIHALVLYGRMTVDDINKPDNDGYTSLHYAAMSETGYNSQYLLMLGADRTLTSADGKTAAEVADNWDYQGKDWKAIMDFQFSNVSAEDFYSKVFDNVILGGEDFVIDFSS